MDIRNGNCLELMKTVPDKSVDLFICDLPYGETNCKWDCKIDMEEFWSEFKRVRKSPRTACIHFCSTKFGYTLINSWEKGFKMDMVWKKRNKTGGLQSRHRPMRNHEMVYFFYDQAPKYNRDKYHKRIQTQNVEDKPKNKTIKATDRKAMGESSGIYSKENQTASSFDPPNPASVVEEEDKPYGKACGGKGFGATKNNKDFKQSNYDPPNPASVVEEKQGYHGDLKKGNKDPLGMDASYKKHSFSAEFHPPNPASVVEEKQGYHGDLKKGNKDPLGMDASYKKHSFSAEFHPPNPASVVEEPEPVSMFESTKVFIGKRHHQTEKPQDILEFFLKYWTDEGDVVLDPTMGSGSTGVACKKLKRKFIGFELDPTIYEVAKKRIESDEQAKQPTTKKKAKKKTI
tara:strand:+ start:1742 stop:2944 length:1203 start_codon:yes stop_codon:yes gene_type:complete